MRTRVLPSCFPAFIRRVPFAIQAMSVAAFDARTTCEGSPRADRLVRLGTCIDRLITRVAWSLLFAEVEIPLWIEVPGKCACAREVCLPAPETRDAACSTSPSADDFL